MNSINCIECGECLSVGRGYSDEQEREGTETQDICDKKVELKLKSLVKRFTESGKLQVDQSVCSECFIKLVKAIDEPCLDLRSQKIALTNCLMNLELSLQGQSQRPDAEAVQSCLDENERLDLEIQELE